VITYVDTSTLLKLLIDEDGSEQASVIWDTADVLVCAATLVVEARAALAAAQRGGRLSASQHRGTKADLAGLLDELTIVEINERLVAEAAELAEQERLRGYDAVHLAAALVVEARVLTSADLALCDAAERQGIHVANPLEPDTR
jgi:predicted nucleic acid-binding protein